MLSNSGGQSRQLEWMLQEFRNSGLERQTVDPTSAGPAQMSSLGRGGELLFGRVIDAIPYIGTYKVLPERGLSAITCAYLTPGPNGAVGARAVSSIPPGAHVWFLFNRDINYGLILGVESYFMTRATLALSDYIYAGSRSGLHRDNAHSFPFTLNTRGLGDWSAGKPFDSTTAGEWGTITETGLRCLVDSAMVQVAASEAAGLWVYLWDQLTRLAGINLQLRANAFEWEALDDEGEHQSTLGFSVYPWELLGAGRPGQTLHREFDAQTTQIDQPWYAAIEPIHDDQISINRVQHLNGYLGQGGRRTVMAPTDETVWRYSAPGAGVTLFEEAIGLHGTYSVRAAKRLLFARRPLMPLCRPKKRPEDLEGDNPENYKASGQYGGGQDHVVKGEPRVRTTGAAPDRSQLRVASAADLQAYHFNWDAVHPQHYHARDFELQEESESELGSRVPVPEFAALEGHGRMYLPDPPTASVNIDHRYQSVDYALSNAYFGILDDGSFVASCGYGASLVLSGGHVTVSAPGDIWTKAGRNVLSWAGRDQLVRARSCVDITATEADVRIKAEKHAWLLAGNGGEDGMLLLESRAGRDTYDFENPNIAQDARAGGIALRTENGACVTWAREIYARTGGGSVQDGPIVLDASRGRQAVVTNSSLLMNFLAPSSGSGRYDAFHDSGQVSSVHAYTSNNMLINGRAQILGDVGVDGYLITNNWIYVDTGHIATAESPQYNFLVPSIQPESLQGWFNSVKAQEESLKSAISTYYSQALDTRWYAGQKGGNDRVMEIAEFSLRTAENQYNTVAGGTVKFRLYEDRWQQMARVSGAGRAWTEKAVVSQGVETMPYPGTEVFRSGQSYIEVDQTMFDIPTGVSKARSGDPEYYTNPQFGEPRPKSLISGYLIIG